MFDAEFWVAVSFFGFIAVAFYYKLPGMITKALDERAAKIRNELEEAQRLREEARTLLAEYQRKQRDAVKEAEEIVAHAKIDAERYAAEAARDLESALARRAGMAETRIAQAEAQAVKDVRAAAVDLAIGAARRLLADELAGERGDKLVDDAISELKTKMH